MNFSKRRRVEKLFACLEAIGITIDETPKQTLPWLRYVAGLVCGAVLTGAILFLI